MKTLLGYTREPIDEFYYDARLAYSMHLALEVDGKIQALNHNSGVLFPLATENGNGSLNPKCLKHPFIFNKKDGGFGVIAVRTDGEGNEDGESRGSIILFESDDMLEYRELGLVKIADLCIERAVCEYNEENDTYIIKFTTDGDAWMAVSVPDINCNYDAAEELGKTEAPSFDLPGSDIEGAHVECAIDISEDVAERLVYKLTVPEHAATEYPPAVTVKTKEEFLDIRAAAVYSDGTRADKRIDWDISSAAS